MSKTVIIKSGYGSHTTPDGVTHRVGDPAFQVSDEAFTDFQFKFQEVPTAVPEVKTPTKPGGKKKEEEGSGGEGGTSGSADPTK